MMQYNIYFGTIGKTLGCKYRFSKWFNSEDEAKEYAKGQAELFYSKNEGKYGIPTSGQVFKESKITGLDFEQLYRDHIDDMMRFYVIPTNIDSVPNRKLKF